MGTTLPDYQGRFLEGASGTVGEAKEAGLPNISGTMNLRGGLGSGIYSPTSSLSGAFSNTTRTAPSFQNNGESNTVFSVITFKASNSNAIYGNSTTVQPASYTVNYIIKAY